MEHLREMLGLARGRFDQRSNVDIRLAETVGPRPSTWLGRARIGFTVHDTGRGTVIEGRSFHARDVRAPSLSSL
jgi:hypothetical protein